MYLNISEVSKNQFAYRGPDLVTVTGTAFGNSAREHASGKGTCSRQSGVAGSPCGVLGKARAQRTRELQFMHRLPEMPGSVSVTEIVYMTVLSYKLS